MLDNTATEFFIDVHTLSNNFLGEWGWQWLKKESPTDEASRYIRFTREMLKGTTLTTNADISDRLLLACSACLYILPHLLSKMLVHSVKNIMQYCKWRMTADIPIDTRKANAILFGTPLSLPFIAILIGLEVLGFSFANYHRIKFHWYRTRNLTTERRQSVDKTAENYHAQQLKKFESNIPQHMLSKFNLVNIIMQSGYIVVRYLSLPLLYGLLRTAKQLLGLVPLSKAIYRTFHQEKYEKHPVDQTRKIFADLKNTLNWQGIIPQEEKIEISVESAKNPKNIFSRFQFGFFSEIRKIALLGHSTHEKFLIRLRARFEAFVAAEKAKGVEVDKITLDNFLTGSDENDDSRDDEKFITFLNADEKNILKSIRDYIKPESESKLVTEDSYSSFTSFKRVQLTKK